MHFLIATCTEQSKRDECDTVKKKRVGRQFIDPWKCCAHICGRMLCRRKERNREREAGCIVIQLIQEILLKIITEIIIKKRAHTSAMRQNCLTNATICFLEGSGCESTWFDTLAHTEKLRAYSHLCCSAVLSQLGPSDGLAYCWEVRLFTETTFLTLLSLSAYPTTTKVPWSIPDGPA